MRPGPKKGDERCREAGRRGGNEVAARYGAGYYSEIGREGGKRTLERHGPEYFREIGMIGGAANACRYAHDVLSSDTNSQED